MRDTRRLRLVLALLVLTCVTLLTLDLRGGRGGAFAPVRDGLGRVFGPVGDGVHALTAPVGRAFAAGAHSGRDGRTIDRLEQQNADLQRQLDSAARAQELQKTLDRQGFLSLVTNAKAVPAKVTQRGAADGLGEETIQIDVGTVDGVRLGNVVVDDGNGVIGAVKRVTDDSATVLLLTDRSSSIGVETRTGLRPLFTVTGAGKGQAPRFSDADVNTQLKTGEPLGTVRLQVAGEIDQVQGAYIGTIASINPAQGGVEQTGTVRLAGNLDSDLVAVLHDQPRTTPRVAVPTSPAPPPPSAAAPTPAPGGSPVAPSPGTPAAPSATSATPVP